jgi:hypothetical protein
LRESLKGRVSAGVDEMRKMRSIIDDAVQSVVARYVKVNGPGRWVGGY